MLIERNLFGVVDKVSEAVILLKENEPADGYYVCFSGGKDSVVVLDLVKRANVKFDVHYAYMTIEPPELLEFIVGKYPEVIFEYPETNMFELIIKHHIPPLRTARYCCHELKRINGVDRVKVTGIRRDESRYRKNRSLISADGKFVNPIVNWKVADVWEYIRTFKIPYCRLYDEGRERIGCILCPNSSRAQLENDIKRYPQFVNYFKKALDTVIENQRRKGKSCKYSSGEDWFNAWIDRSKKFADNEISLFDTNI